MRYAAARDENEAEIVRALRDVGASVTKLDDAGVPDLLIGYRGRTFLVEVKRPAGPEGGTANRNLTKTQQTWWDGWRGSEPAIVHDVGEALRAIGAIVQGAP